MSSIQRLYDLILESASFPAQRLEGLYDYVYRFATKNDEFLFMNFADLSRVAEALVKYKTCECNSELYQIRAELGAI